MLVKAEEPKGLEAIEAKTSVLLLALAALPLKQKTDPYFLNTATEKSLSRMLSRVMGRYRSVQPEDLPGRVILDYVVGDTYVMREDMAALQSVMFRKDMTPPPGMSYRSIDPSKRIKELQDMQLSKDEFIKVATIAEALLAPDELKSKCVGWNTEIQEPSFIRLGVLEQRVVANMRGYDWKQAYR